MTDESKEKKIIIDEDWKSQVEAEREAAERQPQEAPTNEPSTTQSGDQAGPMPWPQPSLPLLVTTLATQAMAAMGLMAQAAGTESNVDLAQAKRETRRLHPRSHAAGGRGDDRRHARKAVRLLW